MNKSTSANALVSMIALAVNMGIVLRREGRSTGFHRSTPCTIRDKVEGERVILLTPFILQMLAVLPRCVVIDKKTGEKTANPWVFSSSTAKGGALSIPRSHMAGNTCRRRRADHGKLLAVV